MRIAKAIFVGSVFAVALTMPAFAKHTEAQKTDDDRSSTTASCHAYQQAENGSWTQLPCQEAGGTQTQHRPAAKGAEEEPR
ncbi:MAG TPA: hypothetical protein VKR55_01470 [Bradyrhizobium sp.]|uniref:hypothetical protein n=1 Tax=Bradyrhizobium sp. TaxID=376 RepID=UPI002C4A231C|nr:hypothetical protein [Bradyrhizobium sp.]HLZ00800.1 hypothetical protein [Bradyrhizobium sp.]